jgi:hypothetical protein
MQANTMASIFARIILSILIIALLTSIARALKTGIFLESGGRAVLDERPTLYWCIFAVYVAVAMGASYKLSHLW